MRKLAYDIDMSRAPEIVGTIPGSDTIFVVLREGLTHEEAREVFSRFLPLDLKIKTEYTKDKEIIKLIEKEKSVLEEYVSTKIVPEIKNRYGEDFFNNYEKSLRKIKISDKEGLKQYIKSAISSYNVNKDKEIKEIEELKS